MNTKALRQKILDLAIHGKLVPQDPNDEPASVLLQRIKVEKERLIKEGKIKRAKKSKATCDKPHYPYELPEGWAWCRLEDIVQITNGRSQKDVEDKGGQYPIYGSGGIIGKATDFLCEAGSTIIGRKGTINNPIFVKERFWNIDTAFGMKPQYAISDIYFFYFCQHFDFSELDKSTAVPSLTQSAINEIFIPIPPTNEQERIVKEIIRCFSVIEILEKRKVYLQSTIAQAKSKILDLAIHGKLVPQDPTDEPASELLKRINPKAEIACDNGQYGKLPKGWCECSFDDIFNITMGQSPDGCSINRQQGVEFHQGKILFGDKYLMPSDVFTDAPTKLAKPNSLLLCVRAPVGVVNITQRKICIGRGLCSLYPNNAINIDYAYYALTTYQSDLESKSTGSTFKAISGSIIRNEIFSLPPLNEQHRIVAKIEELFAQLDNISAAL